MTGMPLSHKERIAYMVDHISEESILKRIDNFVSLWYAKAATQHPQGVKPDRETEQLDRILDELSPENIQQARKQLHRMINKITSPGILQRVYLILTRAYSE